MKTKVSPTYSTWGSMIQRCTNPKRRHYKRYGGRGISVCDRWRVFSNFLQDMGEKPNGTSIDRINNDGNYEPGNCRWATPLQQVENKSIPVNEKCKTCGRQCRAKSRHGECGTCSEYRRRNGIARPLDGKLIAEMAAKKTRDCLAIPVYGVNVKNGTVEKFGAVLDAVRKYGMGVSNCLSRRAKTAKGFVWKYE